MKTNLKLLVIFIISSVIYIVILVFFLSVQKTQISFYEQSRKEQTHEIVTSALKNNTEYLDKLVYDYTYFDYLVDFVLQGYDTTFVNDNLKNIITSYNYSAVWVYDTNMKLIEFIHNGEIDSNIYIPEGLFKSLDKKHFNHSFVKNKNGVCEISSGTIHKTRDINRTGKSYGYFFVGNCWNSNQIDRVKEWTGAQIEMFDATTTNEEELEDKITVIIPLRDYAGFPLYYAKFTRNNQIFNDLIHNNRIAIFAFTFIGILLIVVLFISFFYLVIKPLRKINHSLKSGNTASLGGLVSRNDEFGEVSRLLDVFFSQKKKLENEIKDRIATEIKLSENEEKFSKAFLLNPSAITILSFHDGALLSYNNSFAKLTAYPEQELLSGFNMYKIFGTKRWNEIRQDIRINKTIIDQEAELFTRDGSNRFVIFSAHILILQETECLLTVMTDITERKFIENTLNEAKQKAEENDRLKSFLLANMSHEFRTPLTGILGFAEILKDELSDTNHLSMANHIMISAERLQNTFENIMDMAQIQTGRFWSRSDDVSLLTVIKPILKSQEEQAILKNINFNTRLETDVIATGDQELILRSVRNVLDNAIKFTESGFVEIEIGKTRSKGKPMAFITIKDTGIGIPKEKLYDIFTEFRQVSEGIGRDFEGSGLGLSVAKKFIELMNGEIQVTSEIKKGSVFTILLPLSENNQEPELPSQVLTTEIADILLVDDDKFAAELMTSYLSKQAKIKWAKSEESAYELIENENFTIAFLDINLGAGGNGVNIARYIRETKLNTQINIIAVTGYSDQKERDQIMQTGYFNSYLTKPFKKSTILNLVNSILP